MISARKHWLGLACLIMLVILHLCYQELTKPVKMVLVPTVVVEESSIQNEIVIVSGNVSKKQSIQKDLAIVPRNVSEESSIQNETVIVSGNVSEESSIQNEMVIVSGNVSEESGIQKELEIIPSNLSNTIQRWAIATLITMNAKKELRDNTITYTHQAMLLGYQMSSRFPDIPLLAIVLLDQVGSSDIKLLESAGYQILLRPRLHPAYVTSKTMLAPVYYDQYMKFWLWNETSYDYIVYLDSDTFFRDPSTINFPMFFQKVSEKHVVACPTGWSHSNSHSLPLTWNGGFFIMKPSAIIFDYILTSTIQPSHFLSEYGPDKQWFDVSEMGAFMRDFPIFTAPTPMNEYCSDISLCCTKPMCENAFHMIPAMGNMIHGLKPNGLLRLGAPPSSIFDSQRLDTFASWGYEPTCLLSNFYEPLVQLYIKHSLISV
jgi:hypothetical protein